MQELPHLVSAFAHRFKPLMRDGSQFSVMRFHPGLDGGVPPDSTVKSQQFRVGRGVQGSGVYAQAVLELRHRSDFFSELRPGELRSAAPQTTSCNRCRPYYP